MQTEFHTKREFGLFLTFIGGAMDAFTFIKYNAFPVAQSGNLIIGIYDLYNRNVAQAIYKFAAVIAFFAGVVFTNLCRLFVEQRLKDDRFYLSVLVIEAITFGIVGLPMVILHLHLVLPVIAFVVSMQWTLFNTMEGQSYVNLYVSGNIKGLASEVVLFLFGKANLQNLGRYLLLTIFFVLGAISASLMLWIGGGSLAAFWIGGLFLGLTAVAWSTI
ncbi:YoaK family protein [Furfurilactobacillus curtus]|uniref:Membrane protein n=1 Tax=Furfurilactobacillus curtus TaxID=1746200 RepID=A0ABQ5JP82_9LACO